MDPPPNYRRVEDVPPEELAILVRRFLADPVAMRRAAELYARGIGELPGVT